MGDVWQEARSHLDGLPGGGLNIAYEAIDRHLSRGGADRAALRFVGDETPVRTLAFGELARLTDRFASALRRQGVVAGDTVFVFTGRIPQLYVAVLGAMKAGAVASVLFSNFGQEPARVRLLRGRAKVLLTTAEIYRRRIAPIRDALTEVGTVVVVGDAPPGTLSYEAMMQAADEPAPTPGTAPEDPALLHFTSGTTGEPKGAVHVHAAAVAQYASAAWAFGLHPDDVFWCTADPGWITGVVYGIVAPLLHGVTSVVDEGEFEAGRWYRIIQDHRVTVWYTTPTAIRMLMRAGAKLARSFDLGSLRLIASVGEPLHPETVRWGRYAFGRDIHDTWWQTETGAIMIGTGVEDTVVLGAIGRPVPGVEAAVARRRPGGGLDFVEAASEVGELVLRAGWPSMFRGYFGDPERFAECFEEGWYLTGDLVSRDVDGRYWFVSRGDDVIKSAGHLIGPSEVESTLLEHPAIAEAGVIGKPDPLIGEVVKAFVVLKPGVVADEDLRLDLIGFARARLGPALAPREIAFCRSIPKTRSGKIIRRVLRARELGLSDFDLSALETGEASS